MIRYRRIVPTGRPADDIVLMLARTAALGAGEGAHLAAAARAHGRGPGPGDGGRATGRLGLAEAEFTTELIVSELVTNAVRYGGSPIELRLIRDSALICEVSDGSSTAPHLRRARVFDEGGRGLLLSPSSPNAGGSRQTPTGKTIWAEQPLPAEP
ncbi:Phosphoserine phosphatase RsbU OS=Streptomyces griseorubiginosus OX=67304 GN=rsbU_14 PE=4 SV=1 [Streptomyces griseorubiginosus]